MIPLRYSLSANSQSVMFCRLIQRFLSIRIGCWKFCSSVEVWIVSWLITPLLLTIDTDIAALKAESAHLNPSFPYFRVCNDLIGVRNLSAGNQGQLRPLTLSYQISLLKNEKKFHGIVRKFNLKQTSVLSKYLRNQIFLDKNLIVF